MGKILTLTEHAETEFPGVFKVASNMALPKSTWLNGFKHDSGVTNRNNNQDFNDRVQAVTTTKENTVEECVNEGFTEYERKRIQEADSIPLESFSDNWWNHSVSCEEHLPPYDIDQKEEPPYWLNYELTDNREADTFINNTYCAGSDLLGQEATFKPVHEQETKDKNNTSTRTEKKIQSLKALLAEQEKAISRLRSEGKERNFESEEFLASLKEDQSYSLVKPVLCENDKEVSVKRSHHDLTTACTYKNGFYKVHKPLPKCKGRKRMGTGRTSLSKTKRFRYNFRKNAPQAINSCLARKSDETVNEKFTFQYVKADIKNEALTQDEFLSFVGLVRTEREAT